MNKLWLAGLLGLGLAACGSQPPVPDWQMNAHGALALAVAADLEGNTRVAEREFARGRAEMARTGRPELVARAELLRCAGRVASLDFAPCAGFEPLRADAGAAERAYADYLAGRLDARDAALLPAQQQAAARRAAADPAALAAISDPLARLVAAGVWFEKGWASPAVVAQAVDTASAQGWRRPLLAWLGVQARLAEQGGDAAEAARLRRRMDLVQGTP